VRNDPASDFSKAMENVRFPWSQSLCGVFADGILEIPFKRILKLEKGILQKMEAGK
jgi:hypothetical protein